jgi:hypothetical protein
MSYDDLVAKYHAAIALRRRVEARMFKCVPGSNEGYLWHRKLSLVTDTERQLRQLVRSHIDAPPAG